MRSGLQSSQQRVMMAFCNGPKRQQIVREYLLQTDKQTNKIRAKLEFMKKKFESPKLC